ncbi:MAG: EAL domain-containing protein [Candidatus Krumholzibacteriia bacterium]
MAAGFTDLRVAVNLSGRQFAEPGLVELVRRILGEAGLSPRHLELEITESVLMHDADMARRTIEALRADGVSLAVDDFGTGYSSLFYLKQLPVNRLKISRDFVRDIATDRRDAAIAEAIIGLGQNLGLEIVAEGVESSEQARILAGLSCPQVQGFHYDRPLPSDEVGRRLS